MAALDPKYRKTGSGLSATAGQVLESFGRCMGAGLVYYISTLGILGAQRLSEFNGYQLVGIIPSFDRDSIAPGKIKRVYEGIYAKVLNNGEELLIPSSDSMTANTKALFDFLFSPREIPQSGQ